MVHLTSITSTFFINLLNRLGCKPPPPEGFDLINTVQPVSIVDVDVPLTAVVEPQLQDTVFTAGIVATPGAGAVLADTLAQVAGNYLLSVFVGGTDPTQAPAFDLQRRDAANATSIWTHRFWGMGTTRTYTFQVVLAAGERFRITAAIAGGAGSASQASIWLRPA